MKFGFQAGNYGGFFAQICTQPFDLPIERLLYQKMIHGYPTLFGHYFGNNGSTF